jgi:hypothetical protein
MRWRSSLIATSPSNVPRGVLHCHGGGGRRGRDGSDDGDGCDDDGCDDGGCDDGGCDDGGCDGGGCDGGGCDGGGCDGGGCDGGGEDSTARSGTGSAGGRRGRLRLAASSGPTVRAHFGA